VLFKYFCILGGDYKWGLNCIGNKRIRNEWAKLKKKHEYFILGVVGEKNWKLEEIRLIKLVMWCVSWWIGSLSSCLKHGK
jgi:hypothetical protein